MLCHAQLQRGQCGNGARLQPGEGGGGQHGVSTQGYGRALHIGQRLVVLALAGRQGDTSSLQIEPDQARAVFGLRHQQRMAGLAGQGHRSAVAAELPAFAAAHQLQGATARGGYACQRHGHHFTLQQGGQRGLHAGAAKLGQRSASQLLLPQGHQRQGLALLFQHGEQFRHAQAQAAMCFGDGDAVQPSGYALLPQGLHEGRARGVVRAQLVVVAKISEQALRGIGKGALVFGELKIHGVTP